MASSRIGFSRRWVARARRGRRGRSGLEGLDGQGALVGALAVRGQDDLAGRGRHRLAFEEVVDLLVGDAEGVFVGLARHQRLEVGGGYFVDQRVGRAEQRRHGAHAALVQAGERRDVGRAVAELGEEAHQRLGRVVGADDDAVVRARHRELRHHALARLDVAQHEVFVGGVAELQVAGLQRGQHAVGRGADVHRDGAVGLDDGERGLRLGLVLLHAVGQAHGDEGGVAAFGAQLLHRALRQAAGGERIDAAADAQHQRLQAGLLQVAGQKVDAALQFKGGIEDGRDMQRRDDLALRGVDGG
jgi:hypothetical protein